MIIKLIVIILPLLMLYLLVMKSKNEQMLEWVNQAMFRYRYKSASGYFTRLKRIQFSILSRHAFSLKWVFLARKIRKRGGYFKWAV